MNEALPKLPTNIEAIVVTAANTIAQAFIEAGLPTRTEHGAASQELYTALYLIRQHCVTSIGGARGLDSDGIPLSEIAAVLETIGRIMVSDDLPEYVGYNASWYIDAADMVSKAERDLEAQMIAVEKLVAKGLQAIGEDEDED